MLSMIGMGAGIGAALDTYHRFLQRSKRNKWIVFINDLLFWAVQALLTFYVLLLVNEAELRIYVFLALFCGFAAYQSLLKKLYMNILERTIRFTIQTYRVLAALFKAVIITPIVYLVQLLIALLWLIIRVLKAVLFWIYRLCIRILKVIWKVIYSLLRFIVVLVWKLLPSRVKLFIKKYAGLLKKVEKMKIVILKWYENIKKRLGGPRE